MIAALATVIETKELIETVIAATVTGLGMIIAFSFVILGAARFADMRNQDRPLLATAAALLMFAGIAVTIGGIVLGLVVITN